MCLELDCIDNPGKDALRSICEDQGIERVAVIGLSKTGETVASAFLEAGADVVAIDDFPSDNVRDAAERLKLALRGCKERRPSLEILLGSVTEHADLPGKLGSFDLLVPSPGVAPSTPTMEVLAASSRCLWSEIELAYAVLARRCSIEGTSRRLVAVTGTNGKTTTVKLIVYLLEQAGVRADACGNIGTPMLAQVLGSDLSPVVVAEVSSFQLRYTHTFGPDVSVFLNFAPDHLDWHPSIEDYARSKARIFAAQKAGQFAVYSLDDKVVAKLADDYLVQGVTRIPFTTTKPHPGALYLGREKVVLPSGDELVIAHGDRFGAVKNRSSAAAPSIGSEPRASSTTGALRDGGGRVAPADPRIVPREDMAAALGAILALGLDPAAAIPAWGGFAPPEHRLQPVAEIGQRRFVDDSKATNPHAVVAALGCFDSLVLIAGGRNKGLDFSELADAIADHGGVRKVVCIGEAAPELEKVLQARGVETAVAHDMQEAVELAWEASAPGDAVVLSPACASFDWYRDYADRGRSFTSAVERLRTNIFGLRPDPSVPEGSRAVNADGLKANSDDLSGVFGSEAGGSHDDDGLG
jgi:UDP-N-acetylmuramoylalanine--D-glutamate ligase